MPPHKKLKTEVDEPEFINVVASDSEPETVNFGCDWREQCHSLCDKYSYALKRRILTDVKLAIGEQCTEFHCHRLILALGSPVFEAMFFGELAETGDTVIIPDVDLEGFKHLIRFLYTGQFVVENDETAFKTYFAADKYCVTDLKKRCETYLCHCDVTPFNVWLFFENALFLNSEAIKNRCQDVLKNNLKSSLEQKSFLDINFNTMESFLRLDDLSISEEKILKNIILWAEHQSKIGAESFENILKPLLLNIRFVALTAKEFVDLHQTTRLKDVLNNDDSLSILEHLINPAMCQLPDWCCSKPQRHSTLLSQSSSKGRRKIRSDIYKRDLYSSSSSSCLTTTSSDSSTSTTDDSD